VKHLNLKDPSIIKQSLVRKNLSFNVITADNTFFQITNILSDGSSPAILYASSRKKVKEISDSLNKRNFKSSFYHGGLNEIEKQNAYKNWISEKTPIMVATNAFGMGIDKSNVKYIVHLDLPSSLESYMQEAGRAGRDDKVAFSYLFADSHSIDNLKNRLSQRLLSIELVKQIYVKLNQYYQIAYGELKNEFFDLNVSDFCSRYNFNINQTYTILKVLENEQILLFDKNFNKRSTLKITSSPNNVLAYAKADQSSLIKTILRSYGGVFENYIQIDEHRIGLKLNKTAVEIKDEVTQLANDGLVHYNYKSINSQFKFLVPREDNRVINNIAKNIKKINAVSSDKVKSVLEYVTNKSVCRSKQLLFYFDDYNSNSCGICDICKSGENYTNTNSSINKLADDILGLLNAENPISVQDLINLTNIESTSVIKVLQLLLDSNKLTINSQNKIEKI
jgi:ATP-dependent DNA helicase RecQ